MGERNKRTKLKKSMGPGRSGQLQSVPSLDGDVLYRVVSGQNVQVDRSRCFWDFWQAVF